MDSREIYKHHPDKYDALVASEDFEGNLKQALTQHLREGQVCVEAGAGTGRVTKLLIELGASKVIATEREPAMLAIAEEKLSPYGERVSFAVAEAAALPAPDGMADLGIAGWVFGHFRHWMPERWKESIGAAVSELERVTKPGGTVCIIETLGTGSTKPKPPNPALGEYFEWLETERGFSRQAIRTDYQFESVDKAASITGFFFGDVFEARVRKESWSTIPECTGLWTRRT